MPATPKLRRISTVKIGTRDLGEGDHPFAALADRPGGLVLEADGEAGVVDEVEDRQVEQVAQVEVAGQLVAAVGGQGAAVGVAAVGGDDADRMAVEARETDDLVGAPQRRRSRRTNPCRPSARSRDARRTSPCACAG